MWPAGDSFGFGDGCEVVEFGVVWIKHLHGAAVHPIWNYRWSSWRGMVQPKNRSTSAKNALLIHAAYQHDLVAALFGYEGGLRGDQCLWGKTFGKIFAWPPDEGKQTPSGDSTAAG